MCQKNFSRLWIAPVIASLSCCAHASTIDIYVTTTILPSSCLATIGSGGVVDFGILSNADLSHSNFTVLNDQQLNLTVACTDKTKFAVSAKDNRTGSVVPGSGLAVNAFLKDEFLYGLGKDISNNNIGSYIISFEQSLTTADTNEIFFVESDSIGSPWRPNSLELLTSNKLVSWSSTSNGAPIDVKVLNSVLNVRAVINKKEDLDFSSVITLDGNATLEIVYL